MNYSPSIGEHLLACSLALFLPLMALINRHPLSSYRNAFLSSENKNRFYRLNSLFLCTLGALPLLVWTLGGKPFAAWGLQHPETIFSPSFIRLLLLFILLYILDLLSSFGGKKAIVKWAEHQDKNLPFLPKNKQEYFGYALMSIAAGWGEEIFFRGFLIPYTAAIWPYEETAEIMSVAAPAILFSLGHLYQGAISTLKIGVFAVLLGWMFLASGSILPLIALHVLVNLLNGWLGMTILKKRALSQNP